jgi:hypothetical protein
MKKLLLLVVVGLLWVALIGPAFAQDEPIVFQDEHLSVEIDPAVASDVEVTAYEAVPYDEGLDMPVWAANPEYWEYELLDYPNGDVFFRPATIVLYDTSEFEAYTMRDGDFPYGYQIEVERLQDLLANETDLDSYVVSDTNNNVLLPYLPPANAAQVFRAQPVFMDFQNGSGVRYLSYYSQAVNPIMEQDIFYTFQGITEDGSTYVSVNFPLLTGVFPTVIPNDFNYDDFSNNYNDFLNEALAALHAQSGDAFTPTLDQLDAIVESMTVNP